MKANEALEAQSLDAALRALPGGLGLDTADSTPFATELLAALAHPTRIRIVAHLRKQPMSVTHLAAELGISQANASQHLAILSRAGALGRSVLGSTRTYSLRSRAIGKILDILEEMTLEHQRSPQENVIL